MSKELKHRIVTILGKGILLIGLLSALGFSLYGMYNKYAKEESTSFVEPQQNVLTIAESKTMKIREQNLELYKTYLGESEIDITGIPYDYVEQMVYHMLPERVAEFNIRLYELESVEDDVDFKKYLFTKSPSLEFTNVTVDSEVPDMLKANLDLGCTVIELNEKTYVQETIYSNVDLTAWRNTYTSMLELGGK